VTVISHSDAARLRDPRFSRSSSRCVHVRRKGETLTGKKQNMTWKSVLILAAALALGSLTTATGALAARGGGHVGGHVGGGHIGGAVHAARFGGVSRGYAFHRGYAFRRGYAFHRGYAFRRGYAFHRHFVFRRHFHRRVVFVGYPHRGYGCIHWRHVLTPWGWRWHRVNVCGYHTWHRHWY
jgi:hypothetical protein